MPGLIHSVLEPPPRLRGVIAYAWEHAGDWRTPDDILLPDVGVDIALRIHGEAAILRRGEWRPFPRRVVVGSLGGAVRFRHWGWTHTLGIRLAPGSAALLGVPAAALRDVIAPLGDIAPALDLRLRAFLERRAAGRAVTADLWAALPLGPGVRRDALVEAIAHRLAIRSEPIGDLTAKMDLSRRQLDRRFGAVVGWSPTDFRRIGRLSRAVSLAATTARGWAEVAQVAGYYDQAHLIRDFRRLTGETPGSVFSPDWYANFD